jgi:hypothetical protein
MAPSLQTLRSGAEWCGELAARRGQGLARATIAGAASKERARKNRWPLPLDDGSTGPRTDGRKPVANEPTAGESSPGREKIVRG